MSEKTENQRKVEPASDLEAGAEVIKAISEPVMKLAEEAWTSISKLASSSGQTLTTYKPDENATAKTSEQSKGSTEKTLDAPTANSTLAKRVATDEEVEELGKALKSSISEIDLYSNVASAMTRSGGGTHSLLRRIDRTGPVQIDLSKLSFEGSNKNNTLGSEHGKNDRIDDGHLQWAIDRGMKSPLYNAILKPEGQSRTVYDTRKPQPPLFENRNSLSFLIDKPVKAVEPTGDITSNDELCQVFTNDFTDADWSAVRTIVDSSSKGTGRSILPDMELTGDLNRNVGRNALDIEDGKLEKTEDGYLFRSREGDKEVRVKIDDSTNRAQVVSATGTLDILQDKAKGTTEFSENGVSLLRIGEDGGRIFKTADGKLLKQLGDKIFILNEDETVRGEIAKGEMRQRFANATVIVDLNANTLAEALQNAQKKGQSLDASNQLIVQYGTDLAIMDPILGKFVTFTQTDKGVTATMKVDEHRTLQRGADGKIRVIDQNGNISELSDSQKASLLSNLGPLAHQMKSIIDQMERGSIRTADGGFVTWAGKRVTVRHNDGAEPGSLGNLVSTSTGLKFDETTESGTKAETTVDIANELVTLGAGELATRVDLKTPTPNVENNKLSITDGKVTFKDYDVKIDSANDVTLPDQTKMRSNGNVSFSNGYKYDAETNSVSYSGDSSKARGSRELNVIEQKPLDSFVSSAMGLARSIAARAASGNVTHSELSLLKANISIVSNMIGLFSQLGELPVANELYSSWSLMDASLNQARHKLEDPSRSNEPGRAERGRPATGSY